MAYSRFPSIREKFNGDLITKINKGVECRDFMSCDCNCTCMCNVNGKCAYEGRCTYTCIVYKCTCKYCDYIYIGVTQNTLKDRMAAHYQSIKKLFSNAKKSSTFARHFGNRSHWPNLALGESPSPQQILVSHIHYDVLYNIMCFLVVVDKTLLTG